MTEGNITMENILEKRRIKVEKMKIFNFLCKIATNCKFRSQKLLTMKIQFLFDLYDISEDIREGLRVCKRFLMLLRTNVF